MKEIIYSPSEEFCPIKTEIRNGEKKKSDLFFPAKDSLNHIVYDLKISQLKKKKMIRDPVPSLKSNLWRAHAPDRESLHVINVSQSTLASRTLHYYGHSKIAPYSTCSNGF